MTDSEALSVAPEQVLLTLNVGSSSIKFAAFERRHLARHLPIMLRRLTG